MAAGCLIAGQPGHELTVAALLLGGAGVILLGGRVADEFSPDRRSTKL